MSAVRFGMFYELLSAAFSVVIAGILVYKIIKNGARRRLGLMSAAVLAVFLGYILTCFWAVDTGAALIGIIKFLPLPLFMLAAEQEERDTLADILNLIPPLAVFMTVISAIFMHIPVFSGYFSVAGRLSGFFQYPNTYALFALIGVILLLSGGKFDITRFIMLLLLAGGIVYSGSRTVAVMTVFFVAVMLIRSGSRRLKIIIPLSIGAILAAAAVYALISGNFGSVGRFLMLSLNESTFIGRIIYFKDGLRLIAKNPFGLGYLGFYYTENMKTVVSCDTEKSGKYKMPSSVTGVVYGAFTNCTKLTEVKLSPALTSVVYKIFINCTSLKTVTVPDSVVSVDAGAFENCTALSEISLPNTVISIGMDAFYCSGLTKINLPQQLKWIDPQAFAGSKLKSISIPKSVSYISYNAFANAPLVSLTLPSSEMQIGYAAFAHTSLPCQVVLILEIMCSGTVKILKK